VSVYVERGVIQFDKVLAIPLESRIPNLTHVYTFDRVHEVMVILLTQFNNALNLIRPMSGQQIVDCANDLVFTTEEDQLSIEDFVLFFKGAIEGKYGRILDRMDQQTVFALLEEYREERRRQFLRIKEERHIAYKSMGPSEKTNQRDEIADKMSSLMGKLGNLKEQLREQKEINKMKNWGL
jgi:hypothetical protein